MKYAVVLLVALLAGGGVYALTLRSAPGEGAIGLGLGTDLLRRRGRDRATDEAADPIPAEVHPDPAGDGLTYLRVMTEPPSWTERLQGLLGVIVLVVTSAMLLAASVYGVGHIVNSTISRFLSPH
jgi:hypothetical protein